MIIVGIATRPKTQQAMQLHESANVSVEHGIEGDYRSRPGSRQVTVMTAKQWHLACQQIDVELPWTIRRANILISDWEFSQSDIGKIILIGNVKLQICAETEPCRKMDQQHDGLRKALEPDFRGGVCCKVLSSGTIRCSDSVSIN